MINAIGLFTRLGEELRDFGTTALTREVIAHSIEANAWFTERDILRAVEAIRMEMLDGSKLRAWAEHYPTATTPRRVAVIMAGNIPLVGFFDLLCVLISGHECHFKPSSKDRVLMEYIAARLKALEPSVPIYDYSPTEHYDMAIATGGEEANRYFRDHFCTTRALLRGSRHSVAVLDGRETEAEMEALATDITAYSGLGCRSVSMLFMPRGKRLTAPHAEPANTKILSTLRATKALYTLQQRPYDDYGAFITTLASDFPTRLGEVSIREYNDIAEVEAWLSDNSDRIQCVVSHTIAHAVPFGHAQHPTLWDYADGVDTMLWLSR